MDAGWGAVSLARGGIGDVVNRLNVRNAVEKDVILGLQSAIGYVAKRGGKRKGLGRQVELKDILVGHGRRSRSYRICKERSCRRVTVRPEDHVEAPSRELSGKV